MTIADGVIDSFGALKAAITRYLIHTRWLSDYLNATIMFEATANHRLRVRPMEALNTFQTATGSAPLPSDYLLWRTVLWVPGTDPNSTNETEIDYVHPAYLRSPNVSGDPPVFTIEGNQFHSSRIPQGDIYDIYKFHYYQKIPTITANDSDSNWLLASYPNTYLFGVLVELGALQRNTEMATLYKQRRDELFAEIIQLHALTTGPTSPQVRMSEYF